MMASNGNIFRVTGPLCRELTGHRWIPSQRPETRSSDVSFHLRLNKRYNKQSWGWWHEMPSRSLWRHCNVEWKHHYSSLPHSQIWNIFHLWPQFFTYDHNFFTYDRNLWRIAFQDTYWHFGTYGTVKWITLTIKLRYIPDIRNIRCTFLSKTYIWKILCVEKMQEIWSIRIRIFVLCVINMQLSIFYNSRSTTDAVTSIDTYTIWYAACLIWCGHGIISVRF